MAVNRKLTRRWRASPRRNVYDLTHAAIKTIPARLRRVVDDFGGVHKFAAAHNIHPKYVYRWLHKRANIAPSAHYLIMLAKLSGISPQWLLLGLGTPYLKGRRAASLAKKLTTKKAA